MATDIEKGQTMWLNTFGIVLFIFGFSLLIGVAFITLIRANRAEKNQSA